MEIEAITHITESATLVVRPQPVPVEYRPIWRIAQTIMIMDYCGWGGKCSAIKISALSWGLQNASTRKNISLLAQGRFIEMDFFAIRFDPTLVRVINICCGLGYLTKSGSGMFSLLDPGKTIAKIIKNTDGIFVEDKITLAAIGKSLTEKNLSAYVSDPRL